MQSAQYADVATLTLPAKNHEERATKRDSPSVEHSASMSSSKPHPRSSPELQWLAGGLMQGDDMLS